LTDQGEPSPRSQKQVTDVPRYQTTVRTPWPRQRAFEYLSDLEHFAEWDPGVKRAVQYGGSGAELGATYDVTVAGVGRDLTLRYEIVEIDVPARLEVRAETSMLRSVDVMTFEVADGGCEVTYDADLSLTGVFRLGNPVLGLVFGRIGDRAAGGLRAALEGSFV
jgi:carbon monoxide dehydrogenase subunit G